MSIKFKEKTIDDLSCRVNQFTGTTAFKLFIELLQLLGPGLTSLLGKASQGKISSLLDVDIGGLQGSILSLLSKLDPEKNLDLILRLLADTTVDGVVVERTSFDIIFQGKLLAMFKVVLFSIEVNYQDFLGEKGFQGLAEKLPTQPKNSKPTSTN